MGILRSDRITGLGGANAITGSTSFGGSGNHLKVEGIDDDFVTWWTADFTIEAWVFIDNFASWMYDDGNHFPAMVGHMNPTDTSNYWSFGPAESPAGNSTLKFYYWKGSQNHTFVHTATIKENEWTHIAMSFSTSNGAKLFINGTGTSYISLSGTPQVSSSAVQFVVGQYGNQNISGNISNLRILKGTALYTSDFTPPTNRLEKTSDTKLLICNSASDVTHNDDEKIITSVRSSTNNSGPVASKFTPNSPVGFSTTSDVGSQYGSTFDGFGNFATSTYMVPPGGNTRERGRGRGVHMLGYHGSPSAGDGKRIDYITIQSQGNSIRFGDMTVNRYTLGAGANSTRALFTGGYITGNSPDTDVNNIEFITIASEGNAIDFGDRTQVGRLPACASNDTRCVMASAKTGAGNQSTIDFVQFATTGNATGFGNLTSKRASMNMSCNSTTRGIFSGGYQPSPVTAAINTIEFITFATTGNGTNFGDLTSAAQSSSGGTASSSTRGLIGLGFVSPARVNTIDFITMASEGDALDFGDLTLVRQAYGSLSNSTRGVFLGGNDPFTNTIDFVTIATTGNASPFGELNVAQSGLGAAGSDSHGGLS